MDMYWQSLLFTLETTLPIFILVLLGLLLRRRSVIDDAFIATSSKLVFNITLPVLMFMAVARSDSGAGQHLPLIGFVLSAALLGALLSALWAGALMLSVPQRGAFIQASFRSNLGIIGLALCINAYGEEGGVLGVLLLAVITPVYNLLAVFFLTRQQQVRWLAQLRLILSNPLIIAIVLAVPFSALQWPLPEVALRVGNSLAAMTLPLALIGVGGSLSFAALRRGSAVVLHIVTLKLLVVPVIIAVAAWMCGFRGVELGVICLMFASPTAAAAFVMARSMGSDAELTANAIALTTIGSVLTVSGFVYVLSLLPLV
ncbi:AEC family transporter [Thalassolituus alkanivorans]|uniref:AEC family transporter n=1 Tax=Thalassolituus alkanivorans TaxID=2881055 RepID=UPI001E3A4DFF|nr:AEC family transporter [Thalassolituus alkanivorans]MCB2387888.1 AEC family transporter [Thalassolituus alkanivorans]MCB2422414.1 AEC family transporter [Thalassolituus alkanivorans]